MSPGTVRGVSLPTMAYSWVTTNTVELQRVSLTGSINIVSRTCSTPDVTVAMGTHQLSEFSGVNSATPWKDFSIALNNCPAFHGIYSGTGPRWLSDGTSNNLDSRTNNLLRLRLDPVRTAINPGQGILSLDPSAPGGAAAASGIGLQVADSHGGALPLATLRPSGITPRATEGASYSIPLKARYIQTAGSVTAGPANASAVFTINYQ
ncbi:fimbrial protein [Pseudomonas chlororaphis]|uniref:fimbrial protein n=1 Tax=Pseudomonas chlororaphis TaxID=587753 RepID=UPI001493F432|nr:fimbrial protein [Pseudomonas chlororaphis]